MSINSHEQAQAQYDSIVTYVTALELDWDRYDELRNLAELSEDEKAEFEQLEVDANRCESYDDAVGDINNDPLDVSVRSGWSAPGNLEPEEFRILLCTGGPAVQIIGDLNQFNEPQSARLQHQDWFEPWTDFDGSYDEGVLLTYCRQFYFGE